MHHIIFSTLAVVCALANLNSAPIDGAIADLYDEFVAEDLPLIDSTVSVESKKEELVTKEPSEQSLFFDPDSGNFYEKTVTFKENRNIDNSISMKRPLADPQLLADNNSVRTSCCAPLKENHSFLSIGGTYAYTHFKPQGNPSFHGNLGGVEALYEYKAANKFYGSLKLSWRQGETKASNASRFLVDVTAEERFGYTLGIEDNTWLWTLFTGLGYRFLGHHLKQPAESLRFNYSEFYVPVGLFTDYYINPCFSMGIHATWMPQIFPTVSITALRGARFATSHEWGNVLVEMPFTFFAGKHKHFFLTISPTFQYWRDGHTTAKTSTGEALGIPRNTYFFWGADLNLGYAF